MISAFTERRDRISNYLTSFSADEKEASKELPPLTYLRVELHRVRAGMSDFIVRIATPKDLTSQEDNTVVSIRGSKTLAKYEGVKTLSKVLAEEMQKRNDTTYDWSKANLDNISDMLFGALKYFSANVNIERLGFMTEAL